MTFKPLQYKEFTILNKSGDSEAVLQAVRWNDANLFQNENCCQESEVACFSRTSFKRISIAYCFFPT